jgi:large repetitive protein
MKKVLLLTTIGVFWLLTLTKAQNVFNPNDLNRRWVNNGTTYHNDSTLLTANPNPGILGLQKWVSVRTSGVDSNAWGKDFKPYFINLNGIQLAFRLKYPKSYSNPDSAGKKYPIMLFFHGAGEPGCPSNGGVYNNEKQLVHGGQRFRNRVENNQFDGFLLYPQAVVGASCWSDWGIAGYSSYYNAVVGILDSLGKYVRADVDRVLVDGLSNGGVAAWSFTAVFPQRVAKSAPSAAATQHNNYSDFIHIPIWFASGGKDTNPSPSYAQSTYDAIRALGADIKWSLYPDLGHSVWDTHWAEANFVPFMNDMHKANPLVYFQRYDYCPDSVINARMGITAGFHSYEWQKDGVTIATRINGVNTIVDGNSIVPGSFTGNELRVNSFGTYRVRFRRTATSDWTVYSPKPAVIFSKPVTQSPVPTVTGLRSKVLPAPDGSTVVPLSVATGYFSYQWVRVNDNVVVSNTNTFDAPVGVYKVKTLEQFGCGSNFSPNFTVINAAGNPKPDAAKNLAAFPLSASGIQLDWNENPNAGENETGFEIYRATASGGPYQLIHITAPNVVTYIDNNVSGSTRYYYLVRAVGNFGAAPNSNEATAAATPDNIAPTIPTGLTVACSNRTFVQLKWTASTDNLGVYKYDVYVNGVKTYSTSNTWIEVHELTPRSTYAFSVIARDAAGNTSQPSSQVTANTVLNGVCYKFYNNASGLVEIPDYNVQTPTTNGQAPNVAFTGGGAGVDNFGYLWEGYINLTQTGNYQFQTCSDDGSKFYFNSPYNHTAPATIDNDGIHGTTCANSATINVTTPGIYPIAITFFENGGGETLTFNYRRSASGTPSGSFAAVPNSFFTETAYTPGGTAPTAPSHVRANAVSYKRIDVSWTDNSNNETGFEIVRSTSMTGTYVPVATVAGTTTYVDSIGLTGNTKYYYKVRAIGAFGASSYSHSEVKWNFNGNSFNDKLETGAARNITPAGSAGFTTDRAEGDVAMRFDGTDDAGLLAGSETDGAFPSDGGYSQRTVSLWFKLNGAQRNSKRMLFEFGGSDNGMALRLNSTSNTDSSDLELRINSATTGTATIELQNFQQSGNYIANAWNHVAAVYGGNAIRLYLNGTQVASATSLTFNSVGQPTSSSRIGQPSSDNAGNAFNDAGYSLFNGAIDDFQVINEAASAAEVGLLRTFTHGQSMDTTLAAEPAPATPSGLVAQVVSKDNIGLTWNDNSLNETHFEIWRSVGNMSNWRLVKTVPGGAGATKNYNDTALFANTTYYYYVKAVGIGGTSNTSNAVDATTSNTAPVITNILDFTMKYGTTHILPINAIDEDGDALTFTFENLPFFGSIETVNNGNINITFNPSPAYQGIYTVIAFVDDGHEGRDTAFFTMVVNSNSLPVLAPITDKNMNEGQTLVIPVSATDAENVGSMVWSFDNKPSFATFVDSGNGKGSITLKPGYATSGTYMMTVYADDGNGAWHSRTFSINVNEVDPNETFRINFRYFTGNVPTWNDVDLFNLPAPFNRPNLVTMKGQATTVGIQALASNYGAAAAGVQTGNNSGVVPDNVMRDYINWGVFNFGADDTLRLRVYGLDTARRYNFVFFGSTTVNCCGHNANSVTTYRIDNEVAQVRFYLNSQETDTIFQRKPNAAGQITITMIGDAATLAGGLLNAMIIDAAFDDGTAPAKPLNLTGSFTENSGVALTWVDRAYNEFNYRVYRSNDINGPYTLLNAGMQNKDSVAYRDGTAEQFNTYYYYVVGSNNYGEGVTSDTVKVITENNKPLITNLDNFRVKTDAVFQETFNVTDYFTDVLSVSVQDMPSFLTLADLGNGSYQITASPTIDDLGQHFLKVVAVDDKGGTTTKDFIVTVADKNTRSIMVSFGDYSKVAQAPWNNFLHYGNAGLVMNNLIDENNQPTGYNIAMVEAWSSMFMTGHKTGNNSGVVPDTVLSGGIYYNQANNRSITISGLIPGTDPSNTRYNIVVVGSQNEGYDAVMRMVSNVGGVDTLNAKYNTDLTGNLNGLAANASGQITLTFNRIAGNAMFLNAIIIEQYSNIALMNPVNLYAEPKDTTTVVLSWSDRSNNENATNLGFELQRATDSLFTSPTSINIWGNNSTFTNTGLSPNTKYWYRIRARSGATNSDWSNRVKTITPQNMVFVNFNQNVQSAGGAWNNIETFPAPGVQLANLKNHARVNTGYKLEITKTFNGENNAGMTTGNNSGMGGLVPDLVMQSSYWIDNEQQSQIKLSNLNKNKRYRIGFISSSNWIGGNLTATLTINGRTVYINSWQNTSKIVYIGNLLADDNGELFLNISSTAASANAYSSGIIIEAYDDVNGGAVLNRAAPGQDKNVLGTEVVNETTLVADKKDQVAITTYPNPFTDFINIDFYNAALTNNVAVDVYDVAGRMVMRRNFGQLSEGPQTLRLNTADGKLTTGVYMVTLTVNGKAVAVTKLVKTKQ